MKRTYIQPVCYTEIIEVETSMLIESNVNNNTKPGNPGDEGEARPRGSRLDASGSRHQDSGSSRGFSQKGWGSLW